VVLLVAAGCSSGDDGGGGGLGAGGGAVGDRLEQLPLPSSLDSEAIFSVGYGDLAEAASLAEVELSGSADGGGDVDQMLQQVLAMTGGPLGDDERSPVVALTPEAAHIERLVDVQEFIDEVGWSVFDVRQFVESQTQPDMVTVMEGEFDEDRITEALGEPEDGVWVAGDPEGLDIGGSSAARPIGEPLWLSLVDDRLVVARTAEDMDAVRSSDGPSVADDEVMAGLAEGLDGAGVYSALLYRGDLAFPGTGSATPDEVEARCEDALPEPFVGVGVGIADDDGPVVVLTYVHTDDSAAEATAEALQGLVEDSASASDGQPWSEIFEIDEIGADGNVTVARLRPTDPGSAAIWRQLVLQRGNLVSFC
jgi:hypothetical protein